MNWYWLSFCDPSRPEGEQFIGACIVDGMDEVGAIRTSWEEGCNPGGEVLIVEIQDEDRLNQSGMARFKLLSLLEIDQPTRVDT